MSRILRRPMFRGGRVDSRGTGIASGLSYEKGGRVGYDSGGPIMSRGGLGGARQPSTPTGGSIMSRIRNIPYLGKMIPAAGGTMARYSPYGLAALTGEIMGDTANLFARGTSTPEGYARLKEMGSVPYMFDETNIDVGDAYKYIDEGNQIGEKYGIFPRGGPEQRLKDLGLEDKYNVDGTRIEEIIEDQITNNDKKDNYNNQFRKTDDTEESTEISKADLEERKELFADLLGSKKARGEDISNMLMSFAGKALKEGATTKSAFGEFFEEEAKKPSSKTKVDQAAAQLAINDYIAGKRTKEQTQALIAQLNLKAKLGTADLYENITKIAGAGSVPSASVLESALKVTEDTRGKPIVRVKKAFKDDGSKNYTSDEENYDSFIITESPKNIIYIDANGVDKIIY